MPIQKGSKAAHDRAVKAAATRAKNKARGVSYPRGYKAPKTRTLPETSIYATPVRARHTEIERGRRRVSVTTHVAPGGSRSVKKMSMAELSGEYSRMNQPGWWTKNVRGRGDKAEDRADRRYYAIKQEIRDRYAKRAYGRTALEEYHEMEKARKAKKKRATAKKKNPAAHRRDLEGAQRRLYEAYDRARTPVAKRKILARIKRIESEMENREMDSMATRVYGTKYVVPVQRKRR